MNGIEKNNVLNIVHTLKSKSSYYQKNNKSFDKVMKESQSLQTVQPKGNKQNLVEHNEKQSDMKKLEKLIEDMIGRLEEDETSQDLNGLVDLLSLLQSMIQNQLETSIHNTSSKADAEIILPEGILLTDTKGFMNAILTTNNNQSIAEINQIEDLKEFSGLISTILSKLIDTMKNDSKDEQISTIDLSEKEMNDLQSVLGQFLNGKGLGKEQINKLIDGIAKIISNAQMNSQVNIDSKAANDQQVLFSIENAEVETVSKTKIKLSETENQSFSSSNQTFSGESIKQFALFLGKTTNKAEASQFVRDFQNIIQKSAFTNEMGQQKIFIKLFPENLGRISIELVKNEHGMAATIIASSAKAKELLQSNLEGLKQAFQLNNLQVEKIDLFQSLQTDNSSYLNRERDEKQQNQQQKKSNQSEKDEEVQSSFLDEFMKVSL